MGLTQANRPARFYADPLEDDTLLLLSMDAREGISSLFEYNLIALSEDENIDLNELLGQPARVELDLPDGGTRLFTGHVSGAAFADFHGRLARYELRLSPWLWFLTQSHDCRIHQNAIFQGRTTPEIVNIVCQEHGFTDIVDRLVDDYPVRELRVQYRESSFAFLSRLMEEEGIYYYFNHSEGRTELVLADHASSHEPFEGYDLVNWFDERDDNPADNEGLRNWRMGRKVRSGAFSLRDFNFNTPGITLETRSLNPLGTAHDEYERFDYPGGHHDLDGGDFLVRRRLEEVQSGFEVFHGSGNVRGLQPGFLFQLEGHTRNDQNREYRVLSAHHHLELDDYESSTGNDGAALVHECVLTAMSSSVDYRSPRITAKPIVHGPQTAIVVGLEDKSVHSNELRQIKVQFHWDRYGNRDENSSCWIRVAQPWAGRSRGTLYLPRVGDEVIVEFLEGDPDRPIVTGSVYNDQNANTFGHSQTGIRTRFLGSEGNERNFSELRFDDKLDQAEVSLKTYGGFRVSSLTESVENLLDRFREKGAFKDDADRLRTLSTVGRAATDVSVGDAGHINIVASKMITLSAPKIDMHEFKKDDCGKEGTTTYNDYLAEYRNSYRAQYGGTYTVIYGYSEEGAAQVQQCEVIPAGEYNATYNMTYTARYNENYDSNYYGNYQATYYEPYEAIYRNIYSANYWKSYTTRYGGDVDVTSERSYLGKYIMYTGLYFGSFNFYALYTAVKMFGFELKGFNLSYTAGKVEDYQTKYDFKKFFLSQDGVNIKGALVHIAQTQGIDISNFGFSVQG